MNWVLPSNGLRRLDVCRSADLLAAPGLLQRAFSSVTLAACKKLQRDSANYPRLLAIDEHKARLSREVGGTFLNRGSFLHAARRVVDAVDRIKYLGGK